VRVEEEWWWEEWWWWRWKKNDGAIVTTTIYLKKKTNIIITINNSDDNALSNWYTMRKNNISFLIANISLWFLVLFPCFYENENMFNFYFHFLSYFSPLFLFYFLTKYLKVRIRLLFFFYNFIIFYWWTREKTSHAQWAFHELWSRAKTWVWL